MGRTAPVETVNVEKSDQYSNKRLSELARIVLCEHVTNANFAPVVWNIFFALRDEGWVVTNEKKRVKPYSIARTLVTLVLRLSGPVEQDRETQLFYRLLAEANAEHLRRGRPELVKNPEHKPTKKLTAFLSRHTVGGMKAVVDFLEEEANRIHYKNLGTPLLPEIILSRIMPWLLFSTDIDFNRQAKEDS